MHTCPFLVVILRWLNDSWTLPFRLLWDGITGTTGYAPPVFGEVLHTDECISPKAIILPAELSASAVLINYWNDKVNNAVWITIFMVVVIVINMFGAGVYGECEFIFAYVFFPSVVAFPLVLIVLALSGLSKSSLSLALSFLESSWILEEARPMIDWASGTGRSRVLSYSSTKLVGARVNFWVSHLLALSQGWPAHAF